MSPPSKIRLLKAIDHDDPELLAEMILAAVNEALRSAQLLAESKLGGLSGGALGGLGLPGLLTARIALTFD